MQVPGELPSAAPSSSSLLRSPSSSPRPRPRGAPPCGGLRRAPRPATPWSSSPSRFPSSSISCPASLSLHGFPSLPRRLLSLHRLLPTLLSISSSLASRRHHGCASGSHPHFIELFCINLEVYTFPRGVHGLYSDPALYSYLLHIFSLKSNLSSS
jgi:hypothetical protein